MVDQTQKSKNLKYLVVTTPFGVIKGNKSTIDFIDDVLESGMIFNDYFRLANNTFTSTKLTNKDLESIKKIIKDERNKIKKS